MSGCAETRHAWRYWRAGSDWTGYRYWRRCETCRLRQRRYLGVWMAR